MPNWALALIAAIVMAIALMAPDLDGHQCYEDEAVVAIVQVWDKAGSARHVVELGTTGTLHCIALDDLEPIG